MDLIVNYAAILAAAIVAMGLGFLWYSPVLFGKEWMKLLNITPESIRHQQKSGMNVTYLLQTLGALVMAYVLAHAVVAFGVTDIFTGTLLGFWAWAGLVAPAQMGAVLWEGKSWRFFFISSGYYLASLILMSCVLALWQ
jgi:hypothetical protein